MLDDAFLLPSLSSVDALAKARAGAILIDLRKVPAVRASGKRIRNTETRDPFAFGHDDSLTRANGPLITFCVHGHEVSQFACALLMLHGRDVHYVRGGFEALVAAGAELEDLDR